MMKSLLKILWVLLTLSIQQSYSTIITKPLYTDLKPEKCITSASETGKIGYLLDDLLDNPPTLVYKAFAISMWYKVITQSPRLSNLIGLSENWSNPLTTSRAVLTLWNNPASNILFLEDLLHSVSASIPVTSLATNYSSYMQVWWKLIIVYQPKQRKAYCQVSNSNISQGMMIDFSAFKDYILHYSDTSALNRNNQVWLNADQGQYQGVSYSACARQKNVMFHYSNDEEFNVARIQTFYFDYYGYAGYSPFYYFPIKRNINSQITSQVGAPQRFKNVYAINFNDAMNGQTYSIENSDISFNLDSSSTSYISNFIPGTFLSIALNQSNYQFLISFVISYNQITNQLPILTYGSNFSVIAAKNSSNQLRLQIVYNGVIQTLDWSLGASGSRHTLVIKIGSALQKTNIVYFVDSTLVGLNTFSIQLQPISTIQFGTSTAGNTSIDNFQIRDLYLFPNADAKKSTDYSSLNESVFVISNCLLYAQFSFNSALCLVCPLNYKYTYNGSCQPLSANDKPNSLITFPNLFFGSNVISIVDSLIDPSISKITYQYMRNDNNFDFLILGFYKLEQWTAGQLYTTLAYLHVEQSFKYYFLHLYLESDTKVTLKMTLDVANLVCYTSFTFPSTILNSWQQLGFGYRQSDKSAYLTYLDPLTNYFSFSQSLSCSGNAVVGPLTNSFTVCLGCYLPNPIKYSKYVGKIKQVKLIEGFNGYSSLNIYKYMDNDVMERSASNPNYLNVNTLIDIYSLSLPDMAFSCATGYFFFEGTCTASCSSIVRSSTLLGQYNNLYGDLTSNSCELCPPSCNSCSSKTLCTTCATGYVLTNNQCVLCSQSTFYDTVSKTCVSTCPIITDFMNRICVTSTQISTHSSLISLGLQQLTYNDGVQILNQGGVVQPDAYIKCSIDAPYTFFMFYGGESVLSNYQIHKSWSNLPNNYYKIISFKLAIYGSSSINDVKVTLNAQTIGATISNILKSAVGICTASNNVQIQTVLDLQYEIMDNSNSLDLIVSFNSVGMAIRNVQLTVKKCHSSCKSCQNGSNPWNCTSCLSKNSIVVDANQCVCQSDEYYQSQQCYTSPCYNCVKCTQQNCLRCEDETGKCLQCSTGYSIYSGGCVLDCTAFPLFSQHLSSQYCYQSQILAFEHFQKNLIYSDLEFWQESTDYIGQGAALLNCLQQNFLPNLGQINGNTNEYMRLRIFQDSFVNKYQGFNFQMSLLLIDQVILNTDFIIFNLNGSEVARVSYGYDSSLTSTCVNSAYGELLQQYSLQIFKGDGDIDLQATNNFGSAKSIKSYSMGNFKAYYSKFHFILRISEKFHFKVNQLPKNYQIQNTTNENIKQQLFFQKKVINEPLCTTYIIGSNYSSAKCSACGINATLNSNNQCVCNAGYYIYYSVNILDAVCKICNPACQSCTGPTAYDCTICSSGYTQLGNLCYSCNIQKNSFCGGTQASHTNCKNLGWILSAGTTCANCLNYANGSCGGDQGSQSAIDSCYQAGYYNYNSNSCSSCSVVNGQACGRNEITSVCSQKLWLYDSLRTQCYNCNSDSLMIDQCYCDSICKTCSLPFSSTSCTSCSPPLLLYNNQCLTNCPNGYTANGQQCTFCNELQMPNCYSCYKTCSICSPFQISNIPNSCTVCSSTRQLSNGYCLCKDSEDSRQIFFECSYQDVAVIEPILSNSAPQLTISFGKLLNPPVGFALNSPSISLCSTLFSSQTLQLLGASYSCSIYFSQIVVTFGEDAIIMQGDMVYINPNIFSFQSSSTTLIAKYYNIIVAQQVLVGSASVLFNFPIPLNSCDDINIKFNKLINTGGRGFRSFTWSIETFSPSLEPQQTLLNNLLTTYNSNQTLDLFIPKGLILPGYNVIVKFDYKLKVNIINYQAFNLYITSSKKITVSITSPIIFPLLKYQYGIVVVDYSITQCTVEGDIKVTEPVNLSISSQEYPNFNFQSPNYSSLEYIINITPFTLPIVQITINASASLVSNSLIASVSTYTLDVELSKLYIKIIGGNKQVDYKKAITVIGRDRDYELPTATEPQLINITWTCTDLLTSNSCVNKKGQQVNLPSQVDNFQISANTFNPYTAIQVQMQGTKGTRTNTDSIIILFCELDLPSLDLTLQTIDQEGKTVNLNEEIYTVLNYNSQTNLIYLSFAGTILYQDNVVGIIKFDYFTLRFEIWNYFSAFDRSDSSFQIRFSVYNPNYYMPSSQLVNLNINFPPDQCIFTITQQDSTLGYSLETFYQLSMNNCIDTDLPITYQFFYYGNQGDFDFEIKNPLQVKRRQITDRQSSNSVNTNLPAGQLILMAQAIDRKMAIYNTTQIIQITPKHYTQSDYQVLIQSKIDQAEQYPPINAIYQLAIISEDIAARNQQLILNTSLSQLKIKLQNDLQSFSQQLPLLSTFETLADKAVSVLASSGITYDTITSGTLLDSLISSLSNASTLQNSNLVLSKEKLKQKLFDSFETLDSLADPNKTPVATINDQNTQNKLIQLHDNIGTYNFINILPNEDPIVFTGASTKVLATQITDKYICNYFMCDMSSNDITSSSSNIYNMKILQTNENLYSNDQTFQNYTQWLQKEDPTINNITQYPIVTPSITDQFNKPLASFKKNTALYFDAKNTSNQTKQMGCLTKSKSIGWTQNGCKNVYNQEIQQYVCICSSMNPTTVIDDLENLFANSNLNVAFGSQGLTNLSNFNDFFKYAVFWILLTSTAGFVFLYFKGKALDYIVDKRMKTNNNPSKVFPSQSEISKSITPQQDKQESQSEKQLIKNKQTVEFNPIIDNMTPATTLITLPINQISSEKLKQKSNTLALRDSDSGLILLQTNNLQKNNANTNTNIKSTMILEEINEEFQKPLNQDEVKVHESSLQDIQNELQIDNFIAQSSSDQEQNMGKNEDLQAKNTNLFINTDTHIIVEQVDEESLKPKGDRSLQEARETSLQEAKSQNQLDHPPLPKTKTHPDELIKQFNKIKSVLMFHDFFKIFLLFDPDLPRPLRFLIFYVRTIHSLAISVVFDQQYSIVQKIAVAIVNAISLILIVKVLEQSFKLKSKIGILFSRFFILFAIGGYYYIILSISSGINYSASNAYIYTFFIMFLSDVLVVAIISAFVQLFFAKYILKRFSDSPSGCWIIVSKVIQLQLILEQVSILRN